jgi:hypothetical protein
MFVHVARKGPAGDRTNQEIGAVVEAAIAAALPEERSIALFVFSANASHDVVDRRPVAADETGVAILVHVGRSYPARAKRRLFGHIYDSLERELGLSRSHVRIGIVEIPAANWSSGYAEEQWMQGLGYQLP